MSETEKKILFNNVIIRNIYRWFFMAIFFEGKILILYIILCSIVTIMLIYKTEKQYRLMKLIILLFFYIYLYCLINITQFPIFTSDGMEECFGGKNIIYSFNLIPFVHAFHITSLYNIIATVPMGFLIPMIIRNTLSIKQASILGLFTGISLECGQLAQLIIIGYTLRRIDVDDLICNTIGVILGYVIFKLFCKLIFSISKRMNLLNYITDYLSK